MRTCPTSARTCAWHLGQHSRPFSLLCDSSVAGEGQGLGTRQVLEGNQPFRNTSAQGLSLLWGLLACRDLYSFQEVLPYPGKLVLLTKMGSEGGQAV